MAKGKIIQVLQDSEVFRGLDEDRLLPFADAATAVSFKAGETLIREGQPGAALHILTRGELQVLLPKRIQGASAARISEIRLNTIRPASCFGEYSLMDGRPASASIVAQTEGQLLRIPDVDFNRILESDDRTARIVYRNVLRALIARLREREREYDLVLTIG